MTRVCIVSANQETLDDLRGYLRSAGIESSCSGDLEILDEPAASIFVVILFPDDFVPRRVVAVLTKLLDRRPAILPVLITSAPGRYEMLLAAHRILVLPRMIWAWTINDAVRAHLATEPWAQVSRAGRKRKPSQRQA